MRVHLGIALAVALGAGAVVLFAPAEAEAIDVCGNGFCASDAVPPEDCETCPEDCGGPCSICGNGFCWGADETCETCPSDCGTCSDGDGGGDGGDDGGNGGGDGCLQEPCPSSAQTASFSVQSTPGACRTGPSTEARPDRRDTPAAAEPRPARRDLPPTADLPATGRSADLRPASDGPGLCEHPDPLLNCDKWDSSYCDYEWTCRGCCEAVWAAPGAACSDICV